MEPAPEWTADVEESLADVVAAVRAAGRNAEAQPFWRFLQQGGRLPPGRLLRSALAGPQVYSAIARIGEPCEVGSDSEFDGTPPLQSVSIASRHITALTVQGEVMCTGEGGDLVPVPLPCPAATVSCGENRMPDDESSMYFAAALLRGRGAVFTWPLCAGLECVAADPKEVRGLPSGDPVVALEAGLGISVALTRSGAAYVWGHEHFFGHLGAGDGAAVPIPELSGRRIRRLACGFGTVCAETEDGELLLLYLPTAEAEGSVVCAQPAGVTFPLRQLMTLQDTEVQLIDAAGRIWRFSMSNESAAGQLRHWRRVAGPRGQRVVRIADGWEIAVVLTENGELWEEPRAKNSPNWTSISAVHPELPRGLLPYGHNMFPWIFLVPDASCGRSRCKLLLLVAGRRGLLLADQQMVRIALRPFLVDDAFFWANGEVDAMGSDEVGADSDEGDGEESDQPAGQKIGNRRDVSNEADGEESEDD